MRGEQCMQCVLVFEADQQISSGERAGLLLHAARMRGCMHGCIRMRMHGGLRCMQAADGFRLGPCTRQRADTSPHSQLPSALLSSVRG